MKFIPVFYYFTLTSFILASAYYDDPSTKCKCVDKELCISYKHSSFVPPKGSMYCDRNQVCCQLNHIIQIEHPDLSGEDIDDDNYDPSNYISEPNYIRSNHIKCGQVIDDTGSQYFVDNNSQSYYKKAQIPSEANEGEFPWQVAIFRNYGSNKIKNLVFVSNGVLIDSDVVLSSAHNMIKLNANEILIRLGEINIQSHITNKYVSNAKVTKILIKGDFNRNTLENDLAVLCLDQQFQPSPKINRICLPDLDYKIDYYQDDIIGCVVSGWGRSEIDESTPNYSSVLRKTYLNIVNHDRCEYLLRSKMTDKKFKLDSSLLCAGGEIGKDACKGDGGAPLSCPNKNGQQVLYGLVSYGIGCGEKNVPGVYASVKYQESLKWIKNFAIKECRKHNMLTNYNKKVEVKRPNQIVNSNYITNPETKLKNSNLISNLALNPEKELTNSNLISNSALNPNQIVNSNYITNPETKLKNSNLISNSALNSEKKLKNLISNSNSNKLNSKNHDTLLSNNKPINLSAYTKTKKNPSKKNQTNSNYNFDYYNLLIRQSAFTSKWKGSGAQLDQIIQ